ELTVYNIKGQKVKTLVNTKQERGHYNVVWNGKDGSDRSVASGLYFYKLQAGKKAIVNKMLLLK
ncbi:MAG: T9SS type A sorting domain-containing protein, partial [Candidatus Cloacimonetes bacterium]|nr:T9SS type A sorting domain-containing protein [Candidatus Cloacimonadota bacterium]